MLVGPPKLSGQHAPRQAAVDLVRVRDRVGVRDRVRVRIRVRVKVRVPVHRGEARLVTVGVQPV